MLLAASLFTFIEKSNYSGETQVLYQDSTREFCTSSAYSPDLGSYRLVQYIFGARMLDERWMMENDRVLNTHNRIRIYSIGYSIVTANGKMPHLNNLNSF